jgi:phage FluMu protein gp41
MNDHFKTWLFCANFVMQQRLNKLRDLRRRFFDQNVLTVTYLFLGRYSHLFFFDSWRRWKIYTKRRRAWKTSLWKLRLMWMDTKKRTMFLGWKLLTAEAVKARGGVRKRNYVAKKVVTAEETFIKSLASFSQMDIKLNSTPAPVAAPATTPEAPSPSTRSRSGSIYGDFGESSGGPRPLSEPASSQTRPRGMSSVSESEELGSFHGSETSDVFDSEAAAEMFTRTGPPPSTAPPRLADKPSAADIERLERAVAVINELSGSNSLDPIKSSSQLGLELFESLGSLKHEAGKV